MEEEGVALRDGRGKAKVCIGEVEKWREIGRL